VTWPQRLPREGRDQSGARAAGLLLEHLAEARGGLWLAAVKALPLVATQFAYAAQLFLRLYAFGHHLQSNAMREGDDRTHDRLVVSVGGRISGAVPAPGAARDIK
jgi:hypothetical protein